jgi:thymidylate synthase (FAD)
VVVQHTSVAMNAPSELELRVLREPTVYLVGRQTVDNATLDQFLSDHGTTWKSDTEVGGEYLSEAAGRLCYMSYAKPRPGGNETYLRHILEVGHGSVLEHAVWNFIFTGISRSCTHELVRHRAGMAYSQLSQRYVDESIAEYVEPDVIADDPECHALWAEAVGQAHRAYVKLVEKLTERFHDEPDRTLRRKMARQAARSVLPNATETKIFVSANARAIRHFLEMRASRHAETEIRKLAVAVYRLMVQEAPNLFRDYELVPLPDGTFELTTPYRKV